MEQNQLLFVISQPRSGSTLLQRILANQSSIYTRSEPWLMLDPCYQLKGKGIIAEYESHLARKGLLSFIEGLSENGREYYEEKLSEFYLSLYARYLEDRKETIFLDKTPRYYLIIDELLEIFPKSKFILLFRNPMAVLNSIYETWVDDKIFSLSHYEYDLLQAPDLMMKHKQNQNILTIQYEELVAEPQTKIAEVCDYIGVPYSEEMLRLSVNNKSPWELGDQVNAFNQSKVLTQSLDKWKDNIEGKQKWRLFLDYFNYLGDEKIHMLGYDPKVIEKTLVNSIYFKEKDQILRSTLSLKNIIYGKDLIQAISPEIGQIKNAISDIAETLDNKNDLENKNLKNQLIELNKNLVTKERDIGQQVKKYKNLSIQNEQLIQQVEKSSIKNDRLTQQVEKLSNQNDRLIQQVEKLRNDKGLIMNSRTFKAALLLKKVLMPWR